MSIEQLRTAPIVETTRAQYIIVCPFCGDRHAHGRVPKQLEPGERTRRAAHCPDEHREYAIVRTEGSR